MRLEKKTMATLLAAILIAMMGVMPAPAAESATVGLTVETLPADIISITIVSTVPDPVVLTAKLGAQYPDLATVSIQSTSTVDIDVMAEMESGSDAFFMSCLMINGGLPTPWPAFIKDNVIPDETFEVSLGLDLSTWPDVSTYNGVLIFWATAS